MFSSNCLRASALVARLVGVVCLNAAHSRNYPCSGKKGGISHCQAGHFLCKDGSTSGSKQVCK